MEASKVYFTNMRAKLGDGLPKKLQRLCRAAGTINYEALCLVSKRVPRVAL